MAFGSALKSVLTRFTFDFDGAKLTAINRTTGQAVTNLSAAAKQAAIVKQQATGLVGGFARLGGLLAGGLALKSVTVDFARQAAEIERMSGALGVSTDFFQGFAHSLQAVGIDSSAATGFLADISERMFDASEGSKALADDFKLIGLGRAQLKELAKQGPEAQLMAMADAMAVAAPGAKRTFVAMSGLGDEGRKLIPLLAQGSEGLKRMMDDAKRLGVVMDAKAIKEAKRFNQRMIEMKARLTAVRNQIAAKLIPVITKAAEGFVTWAKEGNNAEKMLQAIAAAAAIAAAIIAKIVTSFVIAQWVAFKGVLIAVVAWFKSLNLQMALASAKVAAMVGGLLILALLIEDLVFFARGDKSLIGEIFGRDEDLLKSIEELKATFNAIVTEVGGAFKELWKSLVMLAGVFGIKLTTVGKLLKTIGKFLFKVILLTMLLIAKAVAFVARLFGILLAVIARVAAFIVDVLHAAIIGIADAFEDAGITGFFEELGRVAKKVADGIKSAFSAAINGIKKGFDAIAAAVNKAWELVLKIKDAVAPTTGVFKGLKPPTAASLKALDADKSPLERRADVMVNMGDINVNGTDLKGPEIRNIFRSEWKRNLNRSMRDLRPGTKPATAGAAPEGSAT
jgi:hypothetical protein